MKPPVIFSFKTLLICPNLQASFGSVTLVSKLAQICRANYKSLIPATLDGGGWNGSTVCLLLMTNQALGFANA